MAYKHLLIAALATIAAAAPLSARHSAPPGPSPTDDPGTRYCLKVEPNTGSRIETIRCETRFEWALLGVDIDKEWPREGVRVIR